LIIITDDFEKILQEIDYDKLFLVDELRVEDVREIKKDAYIASKEKRVIVIAAKKYNIFAQNALLKLLEEPPKNVEFILIGNSKYHFLDTILSRLPLKKRLFNIIKEQKPQKLTTQFILDKIKDIEDDEIKGYLKDLVKRGGDLELINDLLMMLEVNIDKKAIALLTLLMYKDLV
jgi:DNA polymerase-3 subunit delta'